jgi:MFS family permease
MARLETRLGKEQIALIFASIGWFLILSGRYGISTILVDIEASFGMSHAVAGAGMTGMWFFYGLMQFPSGIFSDIRGRKITLTLAMLSFAIAYLLIGVSVHAVMFLAVLVLLGVGAGSFPTEGIAMISDFYQKERGKALGIQSSAGSVAGLMPVVVPVIAAYQWRLFFVAWAVVSLASAYLFWLLSSESTRLPSHVDVVERFKDGFSVFLDKTTVFVFLVNLTVIFVWMGFTSFFPTYLIEEKMFSSLEAGISFAVLIFGGFIWKPIIGSLSDTYRPRLIVGVLTALGTAAIVAIVHIQMFPAVLAISFLLSTFTSVFLVHNHYLMNQWEVKGRAGKLGFYRSVTILVGSPTSAVVGYAATQYGFEMPFLVLALLLGIAAATLFATLALEHRRNGKIATTE